MLNFNIVNDLEQEGSTGEGGIFVQRYAAVCVCVCLHIICLCCASMLDILSAWHYVLRSVAFFVSFRLLRCLPSVGTVLRVLCSSFFFFWLVLRASLLDCSDSAGKLADISTCCLLPQPTVCRLAFFPKSHHSRQILQLIPQCSS